MELNVRKERKESKKDCRKIRRPAGPSAEPFPASFSLTSQPPHPASLGKTASGGDGIYPLTALPDDILAFGMASATSGLTLLPAPPMHSTAIAMAISACSRALGPEPRLGLVVIPTSSFQTAARPTSNSRPGPGQPAGGQLWEMNPRTLASHAPTAGTQRANAGPNRRSAGTARRVGYCASGPKAARPSHSASSDCLLDLLILLSHLATKL